MIRIFNGKRPDIAPSAFVSEAAYVIGDVLIGNNASVWPGAVIRGDVCKIEIGENTSIEDNCVVHGDVRIGNGVIIGHGAVIHCHKIGNNVLIGNNATILNGAEIGHFCIIGAGSMVTIDMKIPDDSLVMGLPAQIKGQISSKQRLELKEGAMFYTKLAREYREEGL
jgi:carbonic anhydrase/acetyltransferase-like protein (isoleucine patch superfamily)